MPFVPTAGLWTYMIGICSNVLSVRLLASSNGLELLISCKDMRCQPGQNVW